MGCDIHMWVFRKDFTQPFQDDGAPTCTQRNYTLFSLLSGVRSLATDHFEPLFADRKWDTDKNIFLKFINNEVLHSHSWFTLQEILDIDPYKYFPEQEYIDDTSFFWDNWRNSMKEFYKGICKFKDVVIYIAYDN